MLFMFVALKVPILLAGALIWWAVHQEPDHSEDAEGGGGRRRPHPPPKLPHAPRRGPHHEAALPSPPRVRRVTARARAPQR
jgi:hypothetical protein